MRLSAPPGLAAQIPQYLHEAGWTAKGKVSCTQPIVAAAERPCLRERVAVLGQAPGSGLTRLRRRAQVGVLHRWSDGVGKSNDVVLIFNFQKRLHPSFALVEMPYDGAWTVRFDGDSAALATGESVIKYKFPLNVFKDPYDHSCY